MVGGALIFGIAAAVTTDPAFRAFAGFGALVAAAHALRDVLAPVRLRADDHGLTIGTGLLGTRRIEWRDIERLRVDDRRHFGLNTRYLEIDVGTTLHLLTRSELGTPVDEVVTVLRRLAGSDLAGSDEPVVTQDEDGDVVPGDLT